MPSFQKSDSYGVELSSHHQTSTGATEPQHHRLATTATDDVPDGDDDHSVHSTSSSSSYADPSKNDLNMLQAAALLCADCLGTGLLALPQDVKVLGRVVGLTFLIVNLPINLYAGTILSNAAATVELEDQVHFEGDKEESSTTNVPDTTEQRMSDGDGLVRKATTENDIKNRDGLVRVVRTKNRSKYSSVEGSDEADTHATATNEQTATNDHDILPCDDPCHHQHHHSADSSTYDFIGMTQDLFHHPRATHFVMGFFYTNIFLVLGDYILVMAHAVAAIIGEDKICLPTAGVLASTMMFGFSQLRTMANLGRSATVVSLLTLSIVVIQCLFAAQERQKTPTDESIYVPPPENVTILRMLSSVASIGFAVGSQKLFLNIRHEMKHRNEAPKSLGTALALYGSVYVAICLLAGPDPPSFLFDDIPRGLNRRLAGMFLWIHVSVSYAINSQAICASMDRMFFHNVSLFDLRHHPKRRWLLLTLLMAVSSYLVANIVPFFKDLVALIGALTSVPLTLLLPAVLHRRVIQVPLWCPTRKSMWSYGLIVFGLAFLFTGLAGSLGSIELDWTNHGPPFSCGA